MLSRRMLTLLFALAILGRTFHCLYVEARMPAMTVRAAGQLPPVENQNDTDPNESCCICKGAIVPPLVTTRDAGLDAASVCPLAVVLHSDQPVLICGPKIGRAYDQYLLGPPPLGGEALRALTHLLLI